MTKKALSVSAFIYINLLPYLCRLPKGVEWAKQYLPDEGHLVDGLLFFHAFYSIPAVLLIISIYASKKSAIPVLLTFSALTIAIVIFNYDYDLASDAQAAIGLIIFPIVASFVGGIAFVLGIAIQRLVVKETSNAVPSD